MLIGSVRAMQTVCPGPFRIISISAGYEPNVPEFSRGAPDHPTPTSHLVTTTADGTPVLVKRVSDLGARARLSGEALVLRALDHPRCVRVVAHGDDGTTAHLALAWVGPHSLATVTGVPAHAAARLLATTADIVADLHRVGLVHRRLTPDTCCWPPTDRPSSPGWPTPPAGTTPRPVTTSPPSAPC